MLYATLVFWLIIIVLAAGGVHRLWTGMAQPRVVNMLLLPGTLMAQLGHVLGLLITGATVNDTTLYKDDETGEPGMTRDPKPRIPIVGPMAIGMLPLLSCAIALFFAAGTLGDAVMAGLGEFQLAATLPTTLAGFWQMMRDQITLMESLFHAVWLGFPGEWPFWLFLYLMICLTVRMAPFPGTLRGTLAAIVVLGVLAALLGQVVDSLPSRIEQGWTLLSMTVATLVFLLCVSAVIRGVASLTRLLASGQ